MSMWMAYRKSQRLLLYRSINCHQAPRLSTKMPLLRQIQRTTLACAGSSKISPPRKSQSFRKALYTDFRKMVHYYDVDGRNLHPFPPTSIQWALAPGSQLHLFRAQLGAVPSVHRSLLSAIRHMASYLSWGHASSPSEPVRGDISCWAGNPDQHDGSGMRKWMG